MAAAWINEFHYDNASTDAGEFVEIAAPAGTDLTGWQIILYNGSTGAPYHTLTLAGFVPDQENGFGTLSFLYAVNGIQNGSPDGIALVDPAGIVVEFISYEGTMTAVGGPADGMTSVDVGASESGTASNTAIGRTGSGDEAADFAWTLIGDDTPGGVNPGQSFSGVIVDKPGSFSIADANAIEGDSGNSPISFTVSRGSDSNVAADVSYTVTLPGGAGGANAGDFVAPVLSGTLSFAANEFSKTIILNIAGDLVNEADETFTVTLSGPTNGATLADGDATGIIANDDGAVGPGTAFINEIHYDNAGTDAGEAIEIAAPAGTNLAGWSLVLYSVSSGATQGTAYNTRALSGVVAEQDDGYGTISFSYPVNGIQNGEQDGVALVNPTGQVVQFLSYEGSFTALNGPAAGLTSTDIGVSEGGSSPLGFSLQLVGAGASAADFSWASARDDNFGSVNTDQDFIGAGATGLVRIGDSSLVEGDDGESLMIFTVYRAGGLGQSASVDWLLNLSAGQADSADLGGGQALSGHVDFAPGISSVQIAVAIAGDSIAEGNETFNLLLANPVGNIAIVDTSATGTILNNDPLDLRIFEIQGEGHRTAFDGQPVTTTGIVTGIVDNGFYLQDPAGDGNSRTSDAIFVFTGGAPGVAVGDGVKVTGTAQEFQAAAGALSITELEADSVTVESSGNTLPGAVLIGVGGLQPPTETIDDDGLTSFDPSSDGADFYEALEGMRVTVDSPVAVSSTNGNGETWVLASSGAGATGVNARGSITISAGDYNPEKIQIDADSDLFAGYAPSHSQGDQLSDVTGILSYSFNNYELLVTEAVSVAEDVSATRESTSLQGDRDHLTIASFNVENLSPATDAVRFDLLAQNIVFNLAAPDIIGLQEVQDGNGLNGSDPLSGVVSAQTLIDAIAAIGGPNYVYVEVAPSVANSTGGAGGGNIRNGYLYNADRVDFVEGSQMLIEDPAFTGSRRPLVADFVFNGETVRLVNVHFTSRIGSDPLWGETQPPADAGDGSRTAQATAVSNYVNNALATDPALKLGVLGDFNGFYFEEVVGVLEAGDVLADLHHLLAEEERYTYQFDGNMQAIDHLLVSGGLRFGAAFDAVHINAEQPSALRSTDHDPIVGRFFIEHANEAPIANPDSIAVDEDMTTTNLWELLLANDTDPDPEDVHVITGADDSASLGTIIFDPTTQSLRYVADGDAFDSLAPGATLTDSFTYTVSDQHGLTSTATVTVTVTGIDDGVTIDVGNGKDLLSGTEGEDRLTGGNGADSLAGAGGHDYLIGGNGADLLFGEDGNDVLAGGTGSDYLHGGAGADIFLFGRGGGKDVVAGFDLEEDRLFLSDGLDVRDWKVADTNGDGHLDLTIAFADGTGSVTLLGVTDFGAVDFASPADLAAHPLF